MTKSNPKKLTLIALIKFVQILYKNLVSTLSSGVAASMLSMHVDPMCLLYSLFVTSSWTNTLDAKNDSGIELLILQNIILSENQCTLTSMSSEWGTSSYATRSSLINFSSLYRPSSPSESCTKYLECARLQLIVLFDLITIGNSMSACFISCST